ncbi:MAG: FG-GAP-like repeat-containing protein, partial [Pirellulaceae bacterium]
DGTDQRNVFNVEPSFITRYFIDGNLPSQNQINNAAEGDFLNLIPTPGDGHQLNLTERSTGTGFWEFFNGQQNVDFTEIEQFNFVERLAIGSDVHTPNQVKVLDAETGNHLFDIHPYESSFKGGVRVATGDINVDGIPDIITAPGQGRASTIKVFDGWDGTEIQSFDVYGWHMNDGLFVAAGNVTGHSSIDIVTAAGQGSQYSEVRVFRNTNQGTTFTDVWGYRPYGNHAFAGASVAVGDINNDEYEDIITAPLNGNVEIVVVAGMAGVSGITELARFFAFGNNFHGGAYVAAGNYLGDGRADIIVGAGQNWGPSQYSSLVQVFDGATVQGLPPNFAPADFSFKAFGNDRASVRLVGKDHDLNGQLDELFAGQGPNGQADQIRVFKNGIILDTIFEDFNGVFLG